MSSNIGDAHYRYQLFATRLKADVLYEYICGITGLLKMDWTVRLIMGVKWPTGTYIYLYDTAYQVKSQTFSDASSYY